MTAYRSDCMAMAQRHSASRSEKFCFAELRETEDGNDHDPVSLLPFKQHPRQSNLAPWLHGHGLQAVVQLSRDPEVCDHQRELFEKCCQGESHGASQLELQRA